MAPARSWLERLALTPIRRPPGSLLITDYLVFEGDHENNPVREQRLRVSILEQNVWAELSSVHFERKTATESIPGLMLVCACWR